YPIEETVPAASELMTPKSPATCPSSTVKPRITTKSSVHARNRVTGPASNCENMIPSGVLIISWLVFIGPISGGTHKEESIRRIQKQFLLRTELSARGTAIETTRRSPPKRAAPQNRSSASRHLLRLHAVSAPWEHAFPSRSGQAPKGT